MKKMGSASSTALQGETSGAQLPTAVFLNVFHPNICH